MGFTVNGRDLETFTDEELTEYLDGAWDRCCVSAQGAWDALEKLKALDEELYNQLRRVQLEHVMMGFAGQEANRRFQEKWS